MRALLVPLQIATPSHVTAANDAGSPAASREYGASREPRESVADEDNLGNLVPVPTGRILDEDVAIDVIVRAPGNVGGARAGWKDSASTKWKGKTAAHIPLDTRMLVYGQTSSADEIMRPKALSLGNGDLLLVHILSPDPVTYSSTISTYVLAPNGTWSAAGSIGLGSTSPFTRIVSVDVVQFPDTGEILAIVCGYDGSSVLCLQRFTAKQPASGTTPTFIGTAIEYTDLSGIATGSSFKPTGMAIELMESGRVAMLVHYYGTGAAGIARSYSDSRGAQWATFTKFLGYVETVAAGASDAMQGGVDIKRTANGSLIALVGVAEGNVTQMDPGGNARAPSLLPLVSDDGDNWVGLLSMTFGSAGVTFGSTGWDWPIGPSGMCEGAVAIADDGRPHFFGALHGDSGGSFLDGTAVTTIFDDLVMIALRKSDVTSKDKPPLIPLGTTSSGRTGVTSSDAFGEPVNSETGLMEVASGTKTRSTMWRMAVNTGAGTNNLDGLTEAAPTFKGVRWIEAVSHRGAIYLFPLFEDTANADRALGCVRVNVWSELNERPQSISIALTNLLRGGVYRQGWSAYATPENADASLVKTGSGTAVLEGLSGVGGMKLTTVATATNWTLGTLGGTKNHPADVRWRCEPITGAGVISADVAVQVRSFQQDAGGLMARLQVRVSATQISLFDQVAGASLGLESGDFSNGVEIVLAFSDYKTLAGLFYKIGGSPSDDPEDAVIYAYAYAPAGTVLGTEAVSGVESVEFGTFTNSAIVSAWHSIHYARGELGSGYAAAYLFTGTRAFDAVSPLVDDLTVDTIGYDNGTDHGTRCPRCTPHDAYLRKGMFAHWLGSAGSQQDLFAVTSDFGFDKSRVFKMPISNRWRSSDDQTDTQLVFDAAAQEEGDDDGLWNQSHMVLQGLNAGRYQLDFSASPTFSSPYTILSNVADPSGSDVRRDVYTRASSFASPTFMVTGTDNRIIRFTTALTVKMRPHQYRSTLRKKWYLYMANPEESYQIVDNTETTILLASAVTDPTDAPDDAFSVYCDRACVTTPLGNGYRYMRVLFDGPQATAEGYFKLDQVMPCLAYRFDTPHPDWGFAKRREPNVATQAYPEGYVDAALRSAALEVWELSFGGLRDREARASVLVPEGFTRGSYQALFEALEACDWGAKPVALLPEYNDSPFALGQTDEVIICRVSGSFGGKHPAYDCAGADSLVRAILDFGPITFKELA